MEGSRLHHLYRTRRFGPCDKGVEKKKKKEKRKKRARYMILRKKQASGDQGWARQGK
jgi:hypothetical protein